MVYSWCGSRRTCQTPPDSVLVTARPDRFNPGDALTMRRPEFELAGDTRAQCRGDRPTGLPGCVYFDVAASAKSAKAAFRPGRRQCRQKCDHSGVALQEHFGDSGGRTEVGVDLEEPAVGVQQTLGRSGEKVVDVLVCAIAVFEPGPEVHVPRRGPAVFASAILHSPLERDARCVCQFGRASQRNLIGGKQCEQMRDVAHSRLVFVVVFAPLL